MAGIAPWGRDAALAETFGTRARGLHRRRNRLLKTACEWPAALVLMLLLSPLLALIAWRVRQDGGPALFVQTREGMYGQAIRVFKFRSMRVETCNANARNSLDATGDRVTPLGHMLRRTGLDELPQLFNVLNGTMSLIGPRPHVFAMSVGDTLYTDLVPGYADRLAARPGITGLAQARGWCGAVDSVQHAVCRVMSDREYIAHWSLGLDLRIALKTARLMLGHLTGRSAA
ncbi:MAG: sugar transferase [Alphaproteobacteria bacterium]|nr:sugar transferase [Alphaproteobacteria bacterium]MCB9931513.1 sugar transferase [Alphaproteobacteria bacterium]